MALQVKNPPAMQRCRRPRFDPWVGKMPGGGHGNPFQYPCWENLTVRGTWWVMVHGVAKSQTQPKRLHMPSCRIHIHEIYHKIYHCNIFKNSAVLSKFTLLCKHH